MEILIDERKMRIPEKSRVFVVGIHLDEYGLLVRKSEIIYGVRVPIDETYVLSLSSAILMQIAYSNQIDNRINLN